VGGSVGDRRSRKRRTLRGWPGYEVGLFLNFDIIKMMYSGILFILFCTVDWLDVEGLNIKVKRLTIK